MNKQQRCDYWNTHDPEAGQYIRYVEKDLSFIKSGEVRRIAQIKNMHRHPKYNRVVVLEGIPGCNWFIFRFEPATRLSNEERIKQRKKELCL